MLVAKGRLIVATVSGAVKTSGDAGSDCQATVVVEERPLLLGRSKCGILSAVAMFGVWSVPPQLFKSIKSGANSAIAGRYHCFWADRESDIL